MSKTVSSENPKFWDKLAKKYAAKPVEDQAAYEKKLEMTTALLTGQDHVLEVACGTGSTAIHIADYSKHVTSTDYSPEMIRIAKDKANSAQIANITFEVASVNDLPALEEPPRVILADSIINLVDDPAKLIRDLAAALPTGGYLISTTACIRDFMPWLRFIAPLLRILGVIPHISIFTQNDLVGWMQAADLDITEVWLPKPKAGVFTIAQKA